MLNGEGNENGEKTIIGLISKKATLHVQHTFFVHFFAVVLQDYNVVTRFMGELSYAFLFTYFFHCRSFSLKWPLIFLIFSPPLQNFHVVLPTKNVSFVCLSL